MMRSKPGRAFIWDLAVFCWVTAATSVCPVALAAKPDASVKVVVGEKVVELKPAAQMRDGKVIAPLRPCLAAIGASVTEKAEGELAITAPDGSEALLALPEKTLTVGGTAHALSAPVELRGGVHVGPIADIVRCLGLAATWDSEDRVLGIYPCVTDVQVRADENGVAVQVVTSAPTDFEVNSLPTPARIYIDAKYAVLRVPEGPRPIVAPGVQRVRCGSPTQQPPTARVVLDLEQVTEYRWDVAADGRHGLLTIGQPSEAAPVVQRGWAQVRAVQTFAYEGGGTDVVALLSAPSRHEFDVRRKPARIILDLLDAVPGIDISSFAGDDRLVDGVGMRPSLTDGHAQIVLEMNQLMAFQIVAADDPPRIAVRFQPTPLRERLVVLDPGHGGNDPGAKGARLGLREKNANLDVGLRLNALLKEHNVRTVMTRSTDVLIPLYDRPKLANTAGADIFVSLHHNAWRSPNGAHGTETYYWRPKDKCLATILHEHMLTALGRKDNGVRTGNYAVLRESQMPAALCEFVYINHSEEEALAADEGFRQRAAQALFDGLSQYVEGPGAPLEESRRVGRG